MTACVLTFTSERDAETCHGKQCMENGQHLKLGSSASGMPLCFRMSHCVLPVPFLATALLFLPENSGRICWLRLALALRGLHAVDAISAVSQSEITDSWMLLVFR